MAQIKKIICNPYVKVLSLNGLEYRTDFNCLYYGLQSIPIFTDGCFFVKKHSRRALAFTPLKSMAMFRYVEENGELSRPYSAVFCKLEGEEDECVILTSYVYYPRTHFFMRFPAFAPQPVFFKTLEDFKDGHLYIPRMMKIEVGNDPYVENDDGRLIVAYSPSIDLDRKIPSLKVVTIDYLYYSFKDKKIHYKCKTVQKRRAFFSKQECLNEIGRSWAKLPTSQV